MAALATTVVLGSYVPPTPATQQPLLISKKQRHPKEKQRHHKDWKAALHCARLTNANQLVLQLDLLDKPATNYANVAYFIYARRNDQWVQVFTSTGARLITNQAGRVTLAPEVFPIAEIQRRLGTTDLSNLELKIATLLRYDLQGRERLQTIQFERVLRYNAIAQTTTTQIATYAGVNSLEVAQATAIIPNPVSPFGAQPVAYSKPVSSSTQREQSRFSLAVVQKSATLSNVVARVSLKARNSQSFLQEQFIGDFRYRLKGKKQKAKFLKGLYAGDRVVVRLFTGKRLIGYSEFELLGSSNTVTLVLPDRPLEYGIVRTVYGSDRNEDFVIDRNAPIYDYFTQVIQTQQLQETRVTFLSTLQSVSLDMFALPGLPVPRPICTYPVSFTTGSYALVNQVIQVFGTNLAPALVSFPGQLVQVVNLSTTRLSVYEVSQLMTTYRRMGVTSGTVVYTGDDDRRAGKKPRKRPCNQGIGNGSEGCDPGNSRPHGGSNDGDDDNDDD